MIDFLLKSTICLIVFLGFYHLVLSREKMHQFNRFYLLISLLISFAIPFITFEFIKIIPVVQNIEPESIDAISKSSENFVVDAIQNEIQVEETVNYIPYLIWSAYVLGVLLLLVRFGKNYFKLISKIKSNPTVKYKNATLVLIEEKILPHTFLNAIFVNSEDYNNRNIEEVLYAHEMVHVTQKHTLDILFIEFLKTIFWFNPLFIFYKKAIQLNHEFLADEEIVKTYNNVPFYQNLLLQKGSGNQTIYLASNLNYLVTKKRLIMMTKNTSQKLAVLKKIAIVPILAGLIYFFCVEIVAQEKVIQVKQYKKDNVNQINTNEREVKYLTYKVSDDEYYKDVICVYYEGVDTRLHKHKKWPVKNLLFSKKYQDLTKDELEKLYFLKFRQEPTIKKSPTKKEIIDFLNVNKYAIWIDGVNVNNSKLNSYKSSDFASFSGSVILKNARSKKHPQPFQYWFYTHKYYKAQNMDKWLSRYGGDSIVMVSSKMKDNKLLKNEKMTIVIDAGHGGKDHGAKINEELESKIVESLAKKIKALNVNEDFKIILLREDDSFISLSDRVNKINEINPSLLISLHINSSRNLDDNGVNAYVSSQNEFYEKSLETANKLIDNISNNKLAKGGVKDANLYIIKNSKCPAILLEVGYLSNENDKAYITSEKGKSEIANRIFNFLKQ
jgi:N-acetylmuramoyl-L-alanine amidase/beta-lactamase regulating signal transducer with metallopeptidase domain